MVLIFVTILLVLLNNEHLDTAIFTPLLQTIFIIQLVFFPTFVMINYISKFLIHQLMHK
jgi:hypothetical protein